MDRSHSPFFFNFATMEAYSIGIVMSSIFEIRIYKSL